MEDEADFIVNADLAVSKFGAWPTFHDAEVLHIELRREGRVAEIAIRAFCTESTVDAKGFFERTADSLITFQFKDIEDLEISGFNEQNVLWGITFERSGERYKVVLSDIYGVGGEFSCSLITVVDVIPFGDREPDTDAS